MFITKENWKELLEILGLDENENGIYIPKRFSAFNIFDRNDNISKTVCCSENMIKYAAQIEDLSEKIDKLLEYLNLTYKKHPTEKIPRIIKTPKKN